MAIDTTPFAPAGAWQFHNPVRIHAGRGCRNELAESLRDGSLLVVTTARGGRQFADDPVLGTIPRHNRVTWVDTVTENPGLTFLDEIIDGLRGQAFDAVIAFGGGSAMDAGKAVNRALAAEHGTGLRALIDDPSLAAADRVPLCAIPTTAGTGSEVTPVATIWHHEQRKKLSLGGAFAHAAFVDPALTDALPEGPTLSTGLDAINQAAESIWNRNATSVTLALATRALQLAFPALPALIDGTGGDRERDRMAEASLLSGLAISNTRVALCHSASYPITAHFGVPHGLACAFTMPAVLRHNLRADDGRFTDLARALTGETDTTSLLRYFDTLHERLDVRRRVTASIPDLDALLALEDGMYTPGRPDNNLAPLEPGDVTQVLRSAYGATG